MLLFFWERSPNKSVVVRLPNSQKQPPPLGSWHCHVVVDVACQAPQEVSQTLDSIGLEAMIWSWFLNRTWLVLGSFCFSLWIFLASPQHAHDHLPILDRKRPLQRAHLSVPLLIFELRWVSLCLNLSRFQSFLDNPSVTLKKLHWRPQSYI